VAPRSRLTRVECLQQAAIRIGRGHRRVLELHGELRARLRQIVGRDDAPHLLGGCLVLRARDVAQIALDLGSAGDDVGLALRRAALRGGIVGHVGAADDDRRVVGEIRLGQLDAEALEDACDLEDRAVTGVLAKDSR
jgi:hypothetical protein